MQQQQQQHTQASTAGRGATPARTENEKIWVDGINSHVPLESTASWDTYSSPYSSPPSNCNTMDLSVSLHDDQSAQMDSSRLHVTAARKGDVLQASCAAIYHYWTKEGVTFGKEPTSHPDNPYLEANMQTDLRHLDIVLEPCAFNGLGGEAQDPRVACAVFDTNAVGSTQALRQTQAKLWEGFGIVDARYALIYGNVDETFPSVLFDGESAEDRGTSLGDLCNLKDTPVFASGVHNDVRIVNGMIVRTSKLPVFSESCSKLHRNKTQVSAKGAQELFNRNWDDGHGTYSIDRDSAVCQIVAHWILSSSGVTPPLLFGGIVPTSPKGCERVVQITQYKGETLCTYLNTFHSRMVNHRSAGGRPTLDELLKVWKLIEEVVDKTAAIGYLHLELHPRNILVEMRTSDTGKACPDRVWLIDVSVSDVLNCGVNNCDPEALKSVMLMHASRRFMAWTEAVCDEFGVSRREVPWMKVHMAVLMEDVSAKGGLDVGLKDLLDASRQEWAFPSLRVEELMPSKLAETDIAFRVRTSLIQFFINTDMAWMAEQVLWEYHGDANAHIDSNQVFDVEFFSRAIKTLDASDRTEDYGSFITDVVSECITWAFDYMFEDTDESTLYYSQKIEGASEPSTLLLCAALCVLNAPSNGVSYHMQRSGRPGLAKRRKCDEWVF